MQINYLYLCVENLKDTKTVDLIAEWVKLETKIADRKRFIMVNKSEQDDIDYLETHLAQWNAIATELDSRCVEAGIKLEGSKFVYYLGESGEGILGQMTYFIPKPTAKDQHDLEGWLLLKEGGAK